MDTKEVEEAVVAGVITNYDPVSQRFECTICERQGISELQAHLKSKDHKNCLIWEAVRNPSAHEYLLRLLPQVVRDAKSNSEVEVTNKATFSYKCLVCVDKKPFSGLTPLTSHFTGKEHTKAKKNRDFLNQLAPVSRVGQFSSPPVMSSEHTTQPNRNRNSNSNSNLPQNSCYPSQVGALDRSSEYPHQHSTPQYTQVPQPYTEGKGYQLYTSSHPTVPSHKQYSASLPTVISHQHHSASQPTVVPSSQPTSTTQRIHPTPTTQHSQTTVVPSSQLTSTTQPSQDNFSNAPYLAPNTMTSSSEHNPAHSHSVPSPTTSTNHNYAAPLSSTNHTYVVPPSSANHNYAAPPSSAHNYATPTSSTDPCTPPSSVTMDMSIGAEGSQMVSDFTGAKQLSADSKEVLRDGIVSMPGNGYYCPCCNKIMTGAVPLMQHIDSNKHRKQRSMLFPPAPSLFDLPDINQLKMTTDTKPIYPNPARPDPLDQPDGSNFNFPWIIKGQVLPKSPDELVYKNLSLPRGLVCILNYHVNSYTTSGVRVGAKKDSFNLKTLFSGMGYRVELYEDLTKQQTTKALDDILANHFLKEVDSFIIVILSHGDNDLNFTTNDNFTMNLDYMRYRFTDGECPNLMSKPKIFLANFCRGPYQEVTKSSLHHDYIGHQEKEAPQDMITIHASLNTFKALRDEQQGTVFVQALCEVLAENAHDTEIGEIYLLLHNAMKLKGGTSPEQQNFVFKKFYFNPVVG